MDRLKKYGFKDENGHPLENCADYLAMFDENKAALEQAEARALRWTHEPPKVAGWYWCRLSRLNMPRCVEVYGSEDGLRVGSGESWRDPSISVKYDAFEWAGPIPAPID